MCFQGVLILRVDICTTSKDVYGFVRSTIFCRILWGFCTGSTDLKSSIAGLFSGLVGVCGAPFGECMFAVLL